MTVNQSGVQGEEFKQTVMLRNKRGNNTQTYWQSHDEENKKHKFVNPNSEV